MRARGNLFRFFSALSLILGVQLAVAPRARAAVHPDVKTVMKTSLYGAAAGTVMGLVAYPMTGKKRSIFIGTSIGLFMGIAVGIYHITHRDDPGNPLALTPVEHLSDPSLEKVASPHASQDQVAWQTQMPILRF